MRGTLKQRSKGSWSIILDEGRDPETGKRRQRWTTVKGTKKQAEAKLVEVLHRLETGNYVAPTKLTVGDFLRTWLRDYATTNVRPRTLQGYRSIIEGQRIPGLGNLPLQDIQPPIYRHSIRNVWLRAGQALG